MSHGSHNHCVYRRSRPKANHGAKQTIFFFRPYISIAELVRHASANIIGKQINELYAQHAISSAFIEKRKSPVQALQFNIDKEWPGQGLQLRPYGSFVSGLGSTLSHFHLVLVDPSRPNGRWTAPEDCLELKNGLKCDFWEPRKGKSFFDESMGDWLPPWYDVDQLAKVLARSRFVKDAQSSTAGDVPMVELTTQEDEIIDVVVNDHFRIETTNLLHAYFNYRPKTLPRLCFGIRWWLRHHGLNDPTGRQTGMRSLSGYAITVVVLVYMLYHQMLPCLQLPELLDQMPLVSHKWLRSGVEGSAPVNGESEPESEQTVMNWDVTFVDAHHKHAEIVSIVKMRGWVGLFQKGRQNELVLNRDLEKWATKWQELSKTDPDWKDVIDPFHVGLHRAETEQEDAELGVMFLALVEGLEHLLVEERVVYYTHLGCFARLNTVQAEEQYAAWRKNRDEEHKFPRKDYVGPQPLEWLRRDLVLTDPFIGRKDVLSSVDLRVWNKLTAVARKASEGIKGHRDRREVFKLEDVLEPKNVSLLSEEEAQWVQDRKEERQELAREAATSVERVKGKRGRGRGRGRRRW